MMLQDLRGRLLAVEEAEESRRSKLVPYGLLSSSFHIVCG
jgi:hypothetical protein